MSLITQKDSVVIFYIEGDARHEKYFTILDGHEQQREGRKRK